MSHGTRRNGISLALAGLIGALAFWASDPRFGWNGLWRHSENVIQSANEAWIGTAVGVAGCVVIAAIGLWLMRRKAA